MKSLASITYIAILVFGTPIQDNPQEVLFVGNSLTFYHDMPSMLQEMFNEKGIRINVQQSTFPGIPLSGHLTEVPVENSRSMRKATRGEIPSTVQKLLLQHWDKVILQEVTVKMLIPEVVDYDVQPSVVRLDSIIRRENGMTILFQPYPISTYPERYCFPASLLSMKSSEREYCSEELNDRNQEFRILDTTCKRIADRIHCKVAPVGLCFEWCKKTYPELQLFESASDPHPSELGSYLIACVFFKQLTGMKSGDLKYTGKINRSDSKKVRSIVDSF